MSVERDQAFADAFAEMRDAYALELPGEIKALMAAAQRARSEEGGAEDAAEARRIAHRLCGTAGSYGFTEIGDAAAKLEVALKAIASKASAPAEAWTEIDGALARITAALAEMSSERPSVP